MKLQRSYHKEVQQIAAHCGIEGSVPLSPQTMLKISKLESYPQITPKNGDFGG